VYTRVAPKNVPSPTVASPPFQPLPPIAPLVEMSAEPAPEKPSPEPVQHAPASSVSSSTVSSAPVTLPLSSAKTSATASPISSFAPKPTANTSFGNSGRLNTANQDSHVLHETLNVINEHITDLSAPQGNGGHRATDSSSEYSSHVDHRLSYIQGEETDEEEESSLTRGEVEVWSADQVAEYLFTVGVEKKHCEVFRDQEISGEALLAMDQTTVFVKSFDLGSVGRRLKTWQKVKTLQDEVSGLGPGSRRTFGSDAGSDVASRTRSRTNTITSSGGRLPTIDDRVVASGPTRRQSVTQTPKMEPAQPGSLGPLAHPISPISSISGVVESPTRPTHEKRPSAASIRDLHHSRRHSSTDFRLTGTTLNPVTTPKLMTNGSFPQQPDGLHKKQPSFDRNWTLGSATAYTPRPQSSAGLQEVLSTGSEQDLQDSAVDLDRGYFSGTETDSRRRNVLRKRDSTTGGSHSQNNSYTEEQRVRSATALTRHSRFGSVGSIRDPGGASSAAQKYYGLTAGPHRRTASNLTTESIRPVPPSKDSTPPVVTKLDGSSDLARSSPKSDSAMKRLSQINHPDFSVKSLLNNGFGLRVASDAVTGTERAKVASPGPIDVPYKDSPLYSPSRTGSSTPSAGPSFEMDSPGDAAKSPSTSTTVASRNSRKKTKKETSAYTRGLQKLTPREAIEDADYSGWMKKKSSNLMTTWKPRLFVLKGRRLAYYYSEDDDQEKGLIDISFHRVLPADNERLTGLHATLTGASNTPTMPAMSNVQTAAEVEADRDPTIESDAMFIFKLVPPRAGLSRGVNFTKPTVHYFAVPNIKQGRLWMAALMKATINRDDTQAITTTYQQKTISLAKARQMRHRPPALMGLDEKGEDVMSDGAAESEKKDANGLGIYDEIDSGVSGIERLGLTQVESARTRFAFAEGKDSSLPQSA
jgi:hypothetical protein